MKKPRSTPVHPDVIAWRLWKKENPDSFTSETLGARNPDYYLENRLRHAFEDGMKTARKMEER